ncbi:hypothetical protein M3G50_01060 [Brachybacterium muris]|uniref:ATP-grasp fold amidoligase family protein n=1 Tax=Brachybacterium muris TaxID=219301 RepID=UPI0021A63F57|nr:ATP-grasp fold amidoligase family protein [Brachybacterium muris]MCT1429358.1 hypothetical protein [Brachybacterium muris]
MTPPSASSQTDEEFRKKIALLRRRQRRVVRDIQRLAAELRELPDSTETYLEAISLLQPGQITQQDQIAVARTLKKPLPNADSFWTSLLERRRRKQLGFVPEKHLGVNKTSDLSFARALGVPAVNTRFTGHWEEIPRDPIPGCIKPVKSSDSRGVFYILPGGVRSVFSSVGCEDWDEVERLASEQLGTHPAEVEWELQDLVTWRGNPGPDLKFYSFYGEIGAVVEVSRHDTPQYAYFDNRLKHVRFTREDRPFMKDLSGSMTAAGLMEKHLEEVQEFSRKIPVPYLRIDYIGSDDGLVFCEFSSAPGQADMIDAKNQSRLGTMYHQAEIRLLCDLLNGKTFDEYMAHPVSSELRAMKPE